MTSCLQIWWMWMARAPEYECTATEWWMVGILKKDLRLESPIIWISWRVRLSVQLTLGTPT